MADGRIVLVSDYGDAGGAATGGAGNVVLDSLVALIDHGVDARLLYGFGTSGAPRASGLSGTDLREGGARGALKAIYNPAAKQALRAAMAAEDPSSTFVILHQWTRYLSPAAVGLLARFPTMVYMHDHFWACPNGAYYDFPAGRPCDRQPLGLRCVTAQCDRHGRAAKLGRVARQVSLRLAAGRSDRRLLLHLSGRAERTIAPLLPRERHEVVHNPLTVPASPPPPARDWRFDVGYVGRLEPEKGLLPLIDALEAGGHSGLFVGEGSLAEEIARRPRLEVRRWQPRETVADAMRSCRMIVLPSLWQETWGLIVAEAMAASVPVLVSDRAGSAELVEQFGGGRIFDPAVPGGLAASLSTMLASPAPPPLADWQGFRAALSARTHAARIVALADEHFGFGLALPSTNAARAR